MRTQNLFINGEWRSGSSANVILDSWARTPVAEAAVGSAKDAADAVEAAYGALQRGLPVSERVRILSAVASWLGEHLEEIAEVIRLEVDKPISAARAETLRAVQTFRFAAAEASHLPGETIPVDAVAPGEGVIAFTIPQPRGVVAAITPFNFPLNLSAHKIGPAIAAGCPVVFKPAGRCPLSAGMITQAFEAAQLPPGFLNLVMGPAAEIVDVWQTDDRVAVVNFTGSPRVGWALKAASPRKSHILELGSNSAMVVHEDADLDRAAADAVTSGFTSSGQVCISLQRLFVQENIADELLERVAELVRRVRFGDPRDETTVVAPLITESDAERLETWIEDARDLGSHVGAGGTREGGLLRPTLLLDVPREAALMRKEAFGPVIASARYATIDAAIALVNDSDFGLNTSIYTSSLATSMRFAREVKTGQILVNLPPSFRTDNMPYGGVKDSGQGVEGVKYAVAELIHQKPVFIRP